MGTVLLATQGEGADAGKLCLIVRLLAQHGQCRILKVMVDIRGHRWNPASVASPQHLVDTAFSMACLSNPGGRFTIVKEWEGTAFTLFEKDGLRDKEAP